MTDSVYVTFNRGEVDELAFAREDVKKVRNSASLIENWLPMRLGPMVRRGGFEVLAEAEEDSRFFRFEYSSDETALLEFGDERLRIWIDDALLTRTSVTSTLSNGDFSSGLTGWTDASGSGASVTSSSGALFDAADTEDAILHQTLGSTQTGAEHALRVVVERAPIRLMIGTGGAQTGDIYDGEIGVGTHSLVFTPDAAVTITFVHDKLYIAKLVSAELEMTGTVEIPTDVPIESVDDIQLDASAGKVFCAWSDAPFVVERRGPKSWSVVEYRVNDGPFDAVNQDSSLTLTPSGLSGDVNITASKPYFRESDVGTLRKIISTRQRSQVTVTAGGNGTNSVFVSGGANARRINYTISGAFVATVNIQRSVDEVTWINAKNFTAPASGTYDDGYDGAEYYYRIFVESSDYASGTIEMLIDYGGGGQAGVARIRSYSSATSVAAQVIEPFGFTSASSDWYASQWGGLSGYPNSLILYEGRLWFAGKSGVWASASNAFSSFDRDLEGASRSIYRVIGSGPANSASWIGAAVRMAVGMAHDTAPVRSSSFGEAITQDNISIRNGPMTGAAAIQPEGSDNVLFFVQRNGKKVCQLGYDGSNDSHFVIDNTTFAQDICSAGVAELAMLREPERRLVVRMADGELRVLLFDISEDVQGWSRISVEGATIQRIVSLPETEEDRLYAVVRYDGTDYLCKLALIAEASSRPADLFTYYAGPVSSCTGLDRFDGETVEAWAGGVKIGDFEVASGTIALGDTYSEVTVGLTITASYQSAKLSQYADKSSLSRRKRIVSLGLYMRNVYRPGIQFGSASDRLDNLPKVYRGKTLTDDSLISVYDTVPMEFEGDHSPDSRVYVKATGPATLLGLTFDFDDKDNDRSQRAA